MTGIGLIKGLQRKTRSTGLQKDKIQGGIGIRNRAKKKGTHFLEAELAPPPPGGRTLIHMRIFYWIFLKGFSIGFFCIGFSIGIFVVGP